MFVRTQVTQHNCIAKKPGLAVYGADARIPEINYVCKDHEEFKLGSLDITPLHTPCHTKGHVCYYVVDPATGEKAVFTGELVLKSIRFYNLNNSINISLLVHYLLEV